MLAVSGPASEMGWYCLVDFTTYNPQAFSIGPSLSTGRSEKLGILNGAMMMETVILEV